MANTYDSQRLEAEPLVERYVGGVAGLQIGRHVLLVASAERFPQQRRSEPLAVQMGFNAYCGQVPMRIAWVVGRHLAEHGTHIRHHIARHALLQDGGDRILVRLHTRWKPQRTPEIAVDAPCRAGREGLARERPDEPAEVGEVLLRIAIHPARNRVSREGQDHNADQSLHIRRPGDSDAAVVHYHARTRSGVNRNERLNFSLGMSSSLSTSPLTLPTSRPLHPSPAHAFPLSRNTPLPLPP